MNKKSKFYDFIVIVFAIACILCGCFIGCEGFRTATINTYKELSEMSDTTAHVTVIDSTSMTETEVKERIVEVARKPKEIISLTKDENSPLYYLVANVNGVNVRFILDTGCSDMLMSNIEYWFLVRNGFLKEGNVTTTTSELADGREVESKIVQIDSVTIGNIVVKDVTCNIIENADASCLIGQNILAKMGEITIDYKNHQILRY